MITVEDVVMVGIVGLFIVGMLAFVVSLCEPAYSIGPHHHLDQRAYNQETQ